MITEITTEWVKANHPPVVKLDYPDYIKAKKGDRIELSAIGTTDPDGDPFPTNGFAMNKPVHEECPTLEQGLYMVSLVSISLKLPCLFLSLACTLFLIRITAVFG